MSELVRQLGYTNLSVELGDITRIEADAIVTPINSAGMWVGGIDGAIQRAAGNKYHSQAGAQLPLEHLDTVVARGDASAHNGGFDDVVFVIDDLQTGLDEVVYAGLEAAHRAGHSSVLVPTMRMGMMAGAVEKTPQETARKLAFGIEKFVAEYGSDTSLENVTVVIYNDREAQGQIIGAIAELPSGQ